MDVLLSSWRLHTHQMMSKEPDPERNYGTLWPPRLEKCGSSGEGLAESEIQSIVRDLVSAFFRTGDDAK